MSDSESTTLRITAPVQREVSIAAARQHEEEPRHTESQERFSRGSDRAYKKRICTAAATGEWKTASSYDKTHPDWICTSLTMDKDTALHIAVRMEQIKFVKNLVERISKKGMEIRRVDGNNALCLAAISGNVKIAEILCHKNPELVCIKGHKDNFPIQLASSAGQLRMVKFLLHRTLQDNHINNLSFQDIVKLFFLTLTNNFYTEAKSLLDLNPKLACIENEDEITALQLLAQSSSHKHTPGYRELLNLLFTRIEEEEDQVVQTIQTRKAMFDAAKSGNTTILELIFNYNPNLFMEIDNEGHNILHIAISYRKGNVYHLIFEKGSYKNVLMQHIDNEGNNVLHLAGKFALEERFGSPTHQSLICSEELWFKEVGQIVPPTFINMKNNKGETPMNLFYREHKRSSEKAIEEVNGIANTFIVVATLLITLGISGALTIRTNNISSKSLLFCDQNIWYMIFLLSIGIGVSFCASSLLQFTSVILPSTWRSKGDYVYSRIIRMSIGYLFLYASASFMGLFSTMSGAILVFNFLPAWVFVFIIPLIIIPVIFFVSFSYKALYVSIRLVKEFCQERVDIILSTEHRPLNYLE